MKDQITALLSEALTKLPGAVEATNGQLPVPEVSRTKDPTHGAFASNIAMQLAKPLRQSPRDIAAAICEHLPDNTILQDTAVAGPGFINFFLRDDTANAVVGQALAQAATFGHTQQDDAPRILLEYVSANPTGPLHVGHGRHAAFGATLANLLRAAGFDVTEEYYVNDAGRQMDILAASVLVRALQQSDPAFAFPMAGYRGEYIGDIANDWLQTQSDGLPANVAALSTALPTDGEDDAKETYIDALIANAEQWLGESAFRALREFAKDAILDDIRDDLSGFGVTPDHFFSEAGLARDGALDTALDVLRDNNVLYEKGGAWWFRATDYGDEKDRVVVRDNGKTTYFASDIAYHLNKRRRGFDVLLDVLGSDHHGYIARVRAGLVAMGEPAESLDVRLVQFVSLYRGGEKMQMGTRSGNFVSLRALRDEVGNDAARLFYIMRSNDQHLDFDLELATSQSNDNPVYYIQYAHARIASVFGQLAEQSMSWDRDAGLAALASLDNAHEAALVSRLDRFSETISSAAQKRAPHMLVNYLRELANELHSYYNAHKFIVDDAQQRNARLALIAATQVALANGLAILGVSAPERM
ncbi:MAG: arginine--tRNA ligase [Pseudomonadota bacterium]